MLALIYISLVSWIPICLLIFMALPARTAVVACLVGGWILLPPTVIQIGGLPDYGKSTATVLGIILGTLIFQPQRLLAYRFKWYDLPALIITFCPFVSSLTNDLGAYDGLSSVYKNSLRWILPYMIGRIYFMDWEGLRELAIGIAIGGFILIPACLFEMKMSGILMPMIYGIGKFEGIRLGGYRPRVFFATGLELGMWMTATSLIATWLWKCGELKRIGPLPMGAVCLPALLITTVLCRSSGALVLLAMGLAALWFGSRFQKKWLLWAILVTPLVYYVVRIPNLWQAEQVVSFLNTYFDEERAHSLAYRLDKEVLLTNRALQRPVWGWGGFGRNKIFDAYGNDIAPTDGMWIVFLGINGFVGLFSWTATMLLPSWRFALRFPAYRWGSPMVGPLAAVAALLGIYMIDCLLNAFPNLIYIVAGGGLSSISPSFLRSHGRGISPAHDLVFDDPQATNQELPATAGTRSISPPPTLANHYIGLARTLKSQGNPEKAKVMWNHAMELLNQLNATRPLDPAIQKSRADCANDFAWFLINEPTAGISDPLLAAELAKSATEANPRCATYWNTLGAAFYRSGEPESAIAAFEQSIALSEGGTAFDYAFMALSHAQLDHQEKAHSWLAQADHWLAKHDSPHPDLEKLRDQAHHYLEAQSFAKPGNTPIVP